MTIDHNLMTADLLLGKLPEEQRVEMEQHFFADAALFDELLIAENELTDAYVAGRLASEDRVLFEQRFLLNPAQRRRAIFADALIKYASRESVGAAPARGGAMSTFWASLSSLVSIRPLALSFGAAAVVLVLTAVFLMVSRPGSVTDTDIARIQMPEAEAPTSAHTELKPSRAPETVNANVANTAPGQHKTEHQKAAAPPVRPATLVSTILLTIGSTRSASGAKVYTLPAKATGVRLRLAVEDRTYSSYVAVVETVEGKQIASQRASKNADGVSILLPASRLTKGDYIVTLKGAKNNGVSETVGEYSFTIDR